MDRILVSAVLALVAGGVLAATQDPRDKESTPTWESAKGSELLKLPAFPWQALSTPQAKRAGFWTRADGRVSRYAVHVDKSGVPEWLHAMADAKLGRGPDLDYEVELYPDGSEVYEIYRKIEGRERQLSAKSDRSVYYVGTELDPAKLPDVVAGALGEVKVAAVEKCVLKEGSSVAEYHVTATVNQMPCRVRIAKDGKLIAVQHRIPAEVEVPLKP